MNLRKVLFQQLLQLIEEAADDEPHVQPSLPIADGELLACVQAPSSFFKQAEDYWAFCYQRECEGYLTYALVREEDCDISLLSDFYQRASLVSTSAAAQAKVGGELVVQRLQKRWLTDLEVVLRLAETADIYLCVNEAEGVNQFYQVRTQQALRALLWNNLVRFYSDKGIGYLEQPQTTEERIAQSLIGGEGADSLFVAFAAEDFIVQIHASVGWFVHAGSRVSANRVQQRLARLAIGTLERQELSA